MAEAATGDEAVAKVEQYHPDVVVMDIRLPGGSGIEACEKIIDKYPETKVIMLTSYAEDEMLFSAIRAGASGYVLKQVGSNELIDAIEAVGRGEALLDPAVTQRVFKEVRKAAREEEASLRKKQASILYYLMRMGSTAIRHGARAGGSRTKIWFSSGISLTRII